MPVIPARKSCLRQSAGSRLDKCDSISRKRSPVLLPADFHDARHHDGCLPVRKTVLGDSSVERCFSLTLVGAKAGSTAALARNRLGLFGEGAREITRSQSASSAGRESGGKTCQRTPSGPFVVVALDRAKSAFLQFPKNAIDFGFNSVSGQRTAAAFAPAHHV